MNRKVNRNDVLDYLIKEYFKDDLDQVEKLTRGTKAPITKAQIERWRNPDSQPHFKTIDKVIRHAVNPRFKIIMEFKPFHVSSGDSNIRGAISGVLRDILGNYIDEPGIYSFYDVMGNILYVGKAKKLLTEMNQTLRRDIAITFPRRSIQNTPKKHYEIVRYISAYHVGETHIIDYPKEVESLILRIAKPPLNTNDGKLDPI